MRGKREKAERREHDHYVTPEWSIRRFLEAYRPPFERDPEAGDYREMRILDPCAARGELLEVVEIEYPEALLGACEINPAFRSDLEVITNNAVVIGDFLQNVEILKACEFDWVITNPPYALAEEFINAALQVAPAVAMLLRINFLASKKRRRWLKQQRPGVFVLPNRPSFTGVGGDMTEYGWFVFGDAEVAGTLDWLELTPAEEIRAANERGRLIHGPQEPSGPLVRAFMGPAATNVTPVT